MPVKKKGFCKPNKTTIYKLLKLTGTKLAVLIDNDTSNNCSVPNTNATEIL